MYFVVFLWWSLSLFFFLAPSGLCEIIERWIKVSIWISYTFGFDDFHFPREYVRDGPEFPNIKSNWRYSFPHDCSPLVDRLLVAML